jgi:hypothetical protein
MNVMGNSLLDLGWLVRRGVGAKDKEMKHWLVTYICTARRYCRIESGRQGLN